MNSESVTVSKRGYIILPSHIRKEMNIKAGTKILINKENNRLILETVPSFTNKLDGLTQKTIGTSPKAIDAFIDTERQKRKDG